MWLIYIAMKVYPFGEESVLVLDLNAQYVYYFEWLRRLLHGEGSFLYTFERTLGGEFLGIFAYYLASPFSFIVALFPKKMITEALLVIFLLKTGLCGLTFGTYLHKTRPR
ncbi:MAG: YfhO family protein, partial [Clostridia bacterium]|nr:YfhO family protein [Clostridia bacterium]